MVVLACQTHACIPWSITWIKLAQLSQHHTWLMCTKNMCQFCSLLVYHVSSFTYPKLCSVHMGLSKLWKQCWLHKLFGSSCFEQWACLPPCSNWWWTSFQHAMPAHMLLEMHAWEAQICIMWIANTITYMTCHGWLQAFKAGIHMCKASYYHACSFGSWLVGRLTNASSKKMLIEIWHGNQHGKCQGFSFFFCLFLHATLHVSFQQNQDIPGKLTT